MRHQGRRLVTAVATLGLSCVVAAGELPTDSLYRLHVSLETQAAQQVGLDFYRGHTTLISMFYGSCPAACPMLMTSLQVYESHLDEAARARLRVLLVSFDAARDTPQQLALLAEQHHTDSVRWSLVSAAEPDARRIAALLNFRYRRLPDQSFDHSLLITLLDPEGRVLATTQTLVGDTAFEAKLAAATAAPAAADKVPNR